MVSHERACPRRWPTPAAGCWCGRRLQEDEPVDNDEATAPPQTLKAIDVDRDALKDQARTMRLGGTKIKDIAGALGVSMTTASVWVKGLNE